MKFTLKRILFVALLMVGLSADAQDLQGIKVRRLVYSNDTLVLDSMSLVPGSIRVKQLGTALDSSYYRIDPIAGKLYWLKQPEKPDTIEISFRTFPMNLSVDHFLRDRKRLYRDSTAINLNQYYSETIKGGSLFGLDGLNRSGSISRGITIGNNQDAVLNSSLNLQLSGKVGNNIDLLAAITDDNIPIQAEGNTQQLQEFDKVFIQLSTPVHKLIAGDFEVKNPEGYFLRYNKKGQGAWYSFKSNSVQKDMKSNQWSGGISASVSKGKFARNSFNGSEAIQGPYRLRGAENENFIMILSGSERIFLDGVPMERGQDRDYIIDYNTAELTFTTKRIITANTRIVAEFQYSDKNYARTLLTTNTGFKNDRMSVGIAFYSEQDSKNQPLQQDLSDSDKALLASVGDQIDQAVTSNVDSVAYNVNELLYARMDTTVNAVLYSPVYVFSTSPDSAHFRVGFSNVGLGNGNYRAVDGQANGRYYQWIAPVNGVPQGSYEPLVQLVSPKLRQLLSANMQYRISSNTQLEMEVAGSRDDINRFAAKDKKNDNGAALKFGLAHRIKLGIDTVKPWQLNLKWQSEISDRHFRPVENYRAVEFTRDWNTGGLNSIDDEVFNTAAISLVKPGKAQFEYALRSYERSTNYHGLMHALNANVSPAFVLVLTELNWLKTSGAFYASSYLRTRDEIKARNVKWIPGLRYELERNETRQNGVDTLSAASFGHDQTELFLQRADSVKFPLLVSISRRNDVIPLANALEQATVADMIMVRSGFYQQNQRIDLQGNYRKVAVTENATGSSEENASGRAEYSGQLLNQALQVNSFYEAGTGREPRKRISYIEVAPGTGAYTWKDYNADGIPQLNEFESATFADEASYIRVLSPTDEYERIFFNQWSATVNFTPAQWRKAGNKKPLWSRFALTSSVSFNNRIAREGSKRFWSPILSGLSDSVLLSAQSSARHVLYFDRNSAVFGMELGRLDQESRQLLSNGVESGKSGTWNALARWNAINWLGLQTSGEIGKRESYSESYAARDYNIDRWNIVQRVSIQPGALYRISVSFRNEEKKNILAESDNEKASIQDAGIEWRLSAAKKGIFSLRYNYINIRYTGATNSSLAYEMLESLKAGANSTWSCSIQRNLGSGMQLSVSYEGRKPSGFKIIHTGNVQVRAYF